MMRTTGPILAIALLLSGCSAPSSTAHASALAGTIQQFLTTNFGNPGDAFWYADITSVTVEDSWVVIGTDFDSKTFAADDICSAASSYVFSNQADPSVASVEVRGSKGQTLVRRASAQDSC
jgi:hypothetical protein